MIMPAKRVATVGIVVVAFSTFFLLHAPFPPAKAQERRPTSSKFLGPGSCSASACHGGIAPAKNSLVLQNEFSTWVVRDRHAQAFRALQEPVAQRMGKILNIGDPSRSPKCLSCHALYVPAEQKGRAFDLSEGVSCESCHGPSSAWLGPHSLKGWSRQQSGALGMYDTKDLVQRSEKCLGCHLGTAEQSVDHAMIAAGHPALVFELDAFTAVMPAHWNQQNEDGVKTWSVGQAVQLRESLRRLQRRAQASDWPELSEMECFSCHHRLVKPEKSWRQVRSENDHKAGELQWNTGHFTPFREFLRNTDAGAAEQLEGKLAEVYRLTSRLDSDRNAIAKAAGDAADTAAVVVKKVASSNETTAAAKALKSFAQNADPIAYEGPRNAEQAAMAMETFAIASERANGKQPALRAAVRELFRMLNDPSDYDAAQFAAQMKKVGQHVH